MSKPFADWLTPRMDKLGYNKSQLADRIGLNRSNFSRILSPNPDYIYYKRPNYENTLAIGRIVGDVSGAMEAAGYMDEYLERSGQKVKPTDSTSDRILDTIKRLLESKPEAIDPLLLIGDEIPSRQLYELPFSESEASAGSTGTADGRIEYQTLRQEIPRGLRTIRVRGECMMPFYNNGDILLVDPDASPMPGQKVVARLDGTAVACKQLSRDENGDYLEATNGTYPRIAADNFEIIGVVWGVLHRE